MMNPKVCISILNWNNVDETLRCIKSLSTIKQVNITIVVLDNGSTDLSAEILSLAKDITFIKNDINLGFAGGHNFVIKYALQRGYNYVWLLNNDAVVEPDCLENLLALTETNPAVGMVSPVIKNIDPPHAYQQILTLINKTGTGVEEYSDINQAKRLQAEHPSRVILWGTGLLIKKNTLEKVGFLDENLFAYSEDTDYSLRCLRAGLTNQVVFESKLRHYQPSGLRPAHYYYYTHRNAFLTWKKYVRIINLLRLTRWNLQLAKRQIAAFNQQADLIDSLKAGIWHGWTNHGGKFEKDNKLGHLPRVLIDFFLLMA